MPITALPTAVQTVNLVTSGKWNALTTPGSTSYHPLWKTVILYELAGTAVLLCGAVILAFLFFRERTTFPRMAIVFVLANSILILGDWLLTRSILVETVQSEANTAGPFLRSTIGSLVWIPYMLKSKRVKATFVN